MIGRGEMVLTFFVIFLEAVVRFLIEERQIGTMSCQCIESIACLYENTDLSMQSQYVDGQKGIRRTKLGTIGDRGLHCR